MQPSNKAYLKEIFSGIQGEGLFIGFRQVFLRFLGCDLRCEWCDTPSSLVLNKSEQLDIEGSLTDNPIELDFLISALMRFQENFLHHSLSLTGGEPLLQANFILTLLKYLKEKEFMPLIYLETGGHLPKQLQKIITYLDFISFDIKLPSSTKQSQRWKEHEGFIEIAKQKEGYAKIVLTQDTELEDIEKACSLLIQTSFPLVLQPVFVKDNDNNFQTPNSEQVKTWQAHCINILGSSRVRVIGQMHKFLNQR